MLSSPEAKGVRVERFKCKRRIQILHCAFALIGVKPSNRSPYKEGVGRRGFDELLRSKLKIAPRSSGHLSSLTQFSAYCFY